MNEFALDLLLNHELVMKNNKERDIYRLHEIELYKWSNYQDDVCLDEYTHKNPQQLINGGIYFHRMKTKNGFGKYKGGTFKGMDFTFGKSEQSDQNEQNEPSKCYFGVLVRAISDDNNNIIEGPSKVVDHIMSVTQQSREQIEQIENIADTSNLCFSEAGIIYLRKCNTRKCDVYVGPRIGLSDKYPEWRNVLYRYVINGQTKKERKKLINLRYE